MCDIEQPHVPGSQVQRSHFRNQRWFPRCLQDFSECPECDGEEYEWCSGGECCEREACGHEQFPADQHFSSGEAAEQVCGGQLQQDNQSAVQADHPAEFQFIKAESIEVQWQGDKGLHEDDVGEQAAGHEQQEVLVLQQVLQCSTC